MVLMNNSIDGNLVRIEVEVDQAEAMVCRGKRRLAESLCAMIRLHGFEPRIMPDMMVTFAIPVRRDDGSFFEEWQVCGNYRECREALGY